MDLNRWVGREVVQTEVFTDTRSRALCAALGLEPSAGAMPRLHHWLHFWDVRPPGEVGPDGHPARGDFLPSIALPRRMWAGGRLRFARDIRFGETVEKRSTILNVTPKSGRSGEMIFVTVRHRLSTADGLAIDEEQDLVFREAAQGPAGSAPAPLPPPADWSRRLSVDPVLLFRFSALTMNGHRIHYDRPYATEVEHYDSLVVHGPLQAMLMLGEAQARMNRTAEAFTFRGVAPATDLSDLEICGTRDETTTACWIAQQKRQTMTGTVTWSETPS